MKKKKVLMTIGILLVCGFFVYTYINRVPYPRINGLAPEMIENTDVIGQKDLPKEDVVSIDISDEAVANWETCKNEEYGYEFKYPNDWYLYQITPGTEEVSIREITACQGENITISQKPSVKNGWYTPTISVSILNYNSPEEYLESISTEVFPVTITKKYLYDDINILQYERQNLSKAVLSHDKSLINIKVNVGRDGNQNEFINEILSTFKFID